MLLLLLLLLLWLIQKRCDYIVAYKIFESAHAIAMIDEIRHT